LLLIVAIKASCAAIPKYARIQQAVDKLIAAGSKIPPVQTVEFIQTILSGEYDTALAGSIALNISEIIIHMKLMEFGKSKTQKEQIAAKK
jgi:hypothetical protein